MNVDEQWQTGGTELKNTCQQAGPSSYDSHIDSQEDEQACTWANLDES